MKNWETLQPDKYCLVGAHRYNKGRTRRIDRIIIHHNAGVRNSTEYLRDMWNSSREASAHYQVEADGGIGQLVNDWDTAWHANSLDTNSRSIGIEHANISGPDRWQISDATIENGAHLVAALCHAYGLGRPVWGKNVFPHSAVSATGCPWQLDRGGEDHDTYMRRATYWYDVIARGGTSTGRHHKTPPKKQEKMLTTKFFSDYIQGWGKAFFGPQFRKLDEILKLLRETRDYSRDIRGQVTGSTRLGDYPGWTMIGKTPGGKGLTYTSGLAALRHDIAALNAKVDRLDKKVK